MTDADKRVRGTFTDTTGRRWNIALTIADIKRIRDAHGLDVLAMAEPGEGGVTPLDRMATDVVAVLEVVHTAVAKQAEATGVTAEAFGEAMGGDAAMEAYDAWWEALTDFSQSLRRVDLAEAIRLRLDLLAKSQSKMTAISHAAEARGGEMIDAAAAKAVEKIHGLKFGDLPVV